MLQDGIDRVLIYLEDHWNLTLTFRSHGDTDLIVYCDAAFGVEQIRRPTNAFAIFHNGNLGDWGWKKANHDYLLDGVRVRRDDSWRSRVYRSLWYTYGDRSEKSRDHRIRRQSRRDAPHCKQVSEQAIKTY